jgi:hypothetical protein
MVLTSSKVILGIEYTIHTLCRCLSIDLRPQAHSIVLNPLGVGLLDAFSPLEYLSTIVALQGSNPAHTELQISLYVSLSVTIG